ncbi:hypothetical protein [Vandammella animalimorsus]|uniref:hypothetical protein n=1 Tax=Vandammella animalimorsus TaxID=2029117 RepID=UPI001552F5B3|nr:hypothetical protein [Vandammella animalimorsus]
METMLQEMANELMRYSIYSALLVVVVYDGLKSLFRSFFRKLEEDINERKASVKAR